MHVRISPKERVVVQIPNRAGGVVPEVGGQVHVGWPAANGIVVCRRRDVIAETRASSDISAVGGSQ